MSELTTPITDFYRLHPLIIIATLTLISLAFGAAHVAHLVVIGQDSAFHIARYFGTGRAWDSGQLIPQLDPAAFGGFGYAPNLFYAPLTAYIVALFARTPMNWNEAMNAGSLFVYCVAAFSMFYCISRVTKNDVAGLISAITFIGAPYFFINSVVRSADGELLGMALSPWVFYGIWKIKQRESGWVPLGLGAAAIVLSHGLSAVIYALFSILLLVIWHRMLRDTSALRQLLLAGLLCFGLSAFFTLPLLEARNAARYNVFADGFMVALPGLLAHRHASLASFLAGPNVPYGVFGILALFILLGAAVAIAVKRKSFTAGQTDYRSLIAGSLGFVGSALIMTSVLFPWSATPASVWVIQFPWRINVVIVTFTAVISGLSFAILVQNFPRRNHQRFKILTVLPIILVLGLAAADNGLMRSQVNVSRVNVYEWNTHFLNTMWQLNVDYLPSGNGWNRDFTERGHQPIVLAGQANVTDILRAGTHFEFEVSSETAAIVELPVFFYPGWRAELDGVRIPVFESDNGFAAVELSQPGAHLVAVGWGMSPATKAGIVVSGLTSPSLACYGIIKRAKFHPRNLVGTTVRDDARGLF